MSERIIDACCLINVYASGKEASIFQACGRFYLPEEVRNEVLRIRRVDEDDPTRLVPQDIDLGDAIAAGYIQTCQLDGQDELDAFVRYAMELDDGEASCLAIAASRNWTVATDDRKARRIAYENGIALTSTPELIQTWVAETSPDEATIVESLRNIERFARFRPRRTDPLHRWWVGFSDKVQDD
jgi:predicted nucleic acid-binding protein